MVRVSFRHFIISIIVLFSMVLTWQLLIGNHRANIARDKAEIEELVRNCHKIQEARYSWEEGWQCKN